MDIINELLAEVAPRAAIAQASAICIGAHWTVVEVLLTGKPCGGIASTLHGGDDEHHHGKRPPVSGAGHLLAYSVSELAALAQSSSLLEASIGLATINALLEVDVNACIEVNAAEVIAARGAGKRVAIVGHFPFTPQIREAVGQLWVLELNPRPGDLHAELAPDILPQADVVALTGTSLINHTFDGLISLCRPDAFVIMLGGTTPLSRTLFAHGVSAVAGTRVIDSTAALRSVSQAATFKQILGKQLLTLFR